MKTTTKLFIILPFLLAAAALFYGCKEDEFDNDGKDIATATGYTYHITVETGAAQEQAAGNGKARSLTLDLNDSDNYVYVVHSTWKTGDQLMAYHLGDNESPETRYSLLDVAQAGIGTQYSAFEGTLVSHQPTMSTADWLCFFYPGTSSLTDSNPTITPDGSPTITPVVMRSKQLSGGAAAFDYYAPNNTIKRLVYLDLSHQDGTIATIGKKFDYQWAKVHPKAVNGDTVQCVVGSLQREIAIWGIRLEDETTGGYSEPWLQIDNIKSADVFDLGTGDFVPGSHSSKKYGITLTTCKQEIEGDSLFYPREVTTSDDGYYYVAVLPGTYYDVSISRQSGGIHTKTFKRVTFEKGKIYRTTIPNYNLNNPNPDFKNLPYVEVQGVKWAKGNFIYYTDPNYGSYWGIAPTQWYVSGGKASQLQQPYPQTANDVDLFRYGAIASALNLTSNDCMSGNTHISQKLYTDNLGQNPTAPTTANYGDIVWCHTSSKHQKYRMPSDAEMRALYKHANVKAAYCFTESYTDFGEFNLPNQPRIYGLYFWTNHGESRIQIFPTRMDQYDDVSISVHMGKGLFLPFTGKRQMGSNIVSFKYMYGANGVYGQYMSDSSNASTTDWDFFFGNMQWNYTPTYKMEAKAIRPVWYETNDTVLDPPYPGFADYYP